MIFLSLNAKMNYSSHLEKRNPWGIFAQMECVVSNQNVEARDFGCGQYFNVISKTNSTAEISEAVDEKSANNDEASDEEKGKGTDYNYKFPVVCTTTNAIV